MTTGAGSRRTTRRARRRGRKRSPLREDPRLWALKWVLVPLASVGILVAGAVEFGPALAAVQGHGRLGYFVAETEHCSKDGCGWTGDFVTLRDQVSRLNVDFIGPHGTFYKGDTLPAIDTGGPDEVYARHGSGTWGGDVAAMAAGAIGFGLWAWRLPYRTVRRRMRGDRFLVAGK